MFPLLFIALLLPCLTSPLTWPPVAFLLHSALATKAKGGFAKDSDIMLLLRLDCWLPVASCGQQGP